MTPIFNFLGSVLSVAAIHQEEPHIKFRTRQTESWEAGEGAEDSRLDLIFLRVRD